MPRSASLTMILHSFREEDPNIQRKMEKLKYKGRKDHTSDTGEIPFVFIMNQIERNLANCARKNMKLKIFKQSSVQICPSLRDWIYFKTNNSIKTY